jgi:predicted nucleic acid-binding protein
MTFVSNTSPVSNLVIIGRLPLLGNQFGRVLIPRAVDSELAHLAHVAASEEIQAAKLEGWLEVVEDGHSPWSVRSRNNWIPAKPPPSRSHWNGQPT